MAEYSEFIVAVFAPVISIALLFEAQLGVFLVPNINGQFEITLI